MRCPVCNVKLSIDTTKVTIDEANYEVCESCTKQAVIEFLRRDIARDIANNTRIRKQRKGE